MSYCDFVKNLPEDNVQKIYHDYEYGVPLENDDELFGRFILEINQAGLSWETILKKKENFRKAYTQFNIKKIASFKEEDKKRLLNDAGIIRNRLKIDAAIHNANVICGLQEVHGSFKNWLDINQKKEKDEWVELFKKTFKFTGSEITGEFLMSTGYLPGAHIKTCPKYIK